MPRRTAAITPQEIERLDQAFQNFTRASELLGRSYAGLEHRVRALNLELEAKNRELQEHLAAKERTEGYLHSILEGLSVGVLVLDVGGRCTLLNSAARRILGLQAQAPPADLTGRLPAPLRSRLEPGSPLGQALVELEGEAGSTTLLRVRASAMEGSNGQERLITLEDVTDVQRLKEQAERSDRLRAMGEMAVRMAHDIRNPLGSIELYASLLRRELHADPGLARMAEHISRGVRSLNHIIANLLTFTRTRRPACRAVDLGRLADQCLAYLLDLCQQQAVTVVRKFEPCLGPAWADADLLGQALTNLILNAIQAMPAGGELTLVTAAPAEACADRPTVALTVADTGVGIPREQLQQIFAPFFTTKEKGTGLGLAIVHNIVEAHAGSISVQSCPNQGSAFTVLLPAATAAGEAG